MQIRTTDEPNFAQEWYLKNEEAELLAEALNYWKSEHVCEPSEKNCTTCKAIEHMEFGSAMKFLLS